MGVGEVDLDVDRLRAEFERETGLSPRAWERRWRADELEDTAEHMRLAIRALGLLSLSGSLRFRAGSRRRSGSEQDTRRRPAAHSR